MARNHQFRVDLGYKRKEFRSHLFLNEFETSTGGEFNSLNRRDTYTSDDVVKTLSDQFSSMSLLRPKPIPIPSLPSSLQSLRPKVPNADQRLYGGMLKLDPFFELHLSMLRKNELQQDRAKVLQRQETRLHKGGLIHRNANVLRESVGTGVFHPLQRPTSKTFNSAKKRNQMNWNQSEELLSKERRVLSTAQEEEKDECHYHLPSDMDFSKDWTF